MPVAFLDRVAHTLNMTKISNLRPKLVMLSIMFLAVLIASGFELLGCSSVTEEKPTDSEDDTVELEPLELEWELLTGPADIGNGMNMLGYGEKLYAFGGSSAILGESIYIYDIATDSWERDMDSMPHYRESGVGAMIEGTLYAIGGTDPDTCGGEYTCGQISDVDAYDTVTETWSTVASLNEARDVASVGVVDGKIYVMGGMYRPDGATDVSNRSTVEVYDPVQDVWTLQNSEMPHPIRSAAYATYEKKIYLFGGCSTTEESAELGAEGTCQQHLVQIYDTENDSWEVLDDDDSMMPTGRHFSGQHAAQVGGWILVWGGATDLGATKFSLIEAFNLETETWTTATDLQAERKSTAAILHNDYLYVLAGATTGVEEELRIGMERAYLGDL